jgi:pantoate--beta-alanine ligase
MQVIHSVPELRAALHGQQPVAFVPTMGNLHEGHLALVKQARHKLGSTGKVVVSIFVNRLQFAPHEDFNTYPRTLSEDCEKLAPAGCDIVFAPSEVELYPEPQAYKVHPDPALGDLLEGHFRPGFFTGVCTVVAKLFNLVQPQIAIFGQKDYQQLMVIKRMTQQLAWPIHIESGSTLRSDDGLALSSRNRYLSAEERKQSVQLHASLQQMVEKVPLLRSGMLDLVTTEAHASEHLQALGWQVDYLTLRRRCDLLQPNPQDLQQGIGLVALGAARLGHTRLIDNLEC